MTAWHTLLTAAGRHRRGVSAFLVVGLWWTAAVSKAASLADFSAVTDHLTFLPPTLRVALVPSTPISEAIVGFLIIPLATRTFGLFVSLFALGVLTAVRVWLFATAPDVHCQCFGLIEYALAARAGAIESLIRNALMMLLCAAAVPPRRRRPPPIGVPGFITGRPVAIARGFTIVELLVVISIFAVLFALLAPAISNVRRLSRRTVCASHLHQIGNAAQTWSTSHRGYLPLDNYVIVDPAVVTADDLPDALGDPGGQKYGYTSTAPGGPTFVDSPFSVSPTPFVPCLAQMLPGTGTLGPSGSWSADVDRCRALEVFQCPDVTPAERLLETPDSIFEGGPTLMVAFGATADYSPWWTDSDYASNGWLLGFDYEPRRCGPAGNTARIRDTTRTVVMTDAGGWYKAWDRSPFVPGQPVSLGDVVAANAPTNWAKADRRRHGGNMNALFADGHVDSLKSTPAGLGAAWLSGP